MIRIDYDSNIVGSGVNRVVGYRKAAAIAAKGKKRWQKNSNAATMTRE